VVLVVDAGLVSLFGPSPGMQVLAFNQELPNFDLWIPIMSLPGQLGITVENLKSPLTYLTIDPAALTVWQQRLGARRRLRVGVSWSGRKDTWIHQHKSVPFGQIVNMIQACPQYQWVNLQIDCDAAESQVLENLGVSTYPGTISCMADSAALISCLDVVISVDTAVSHLAAALGRPTWILLNQYGQDWRWLLNRADTPWYPTARLFRQPTMGNWGPAITQIMRHLNLFKI
jgi:hypothetical protein